jgi:hypothetical protein
MMILWTNGPLIKIWMQLMGHANRATVPFCTGMYGRLTPNGSPEEMEEIVCPCLSDSRSEGIAGLRPRLVCHCGNQFAAKGLG